jgi:hypothetical protein
MKNRTGMLGCMVVALVAMGLGGCRTTSGTSEATAALVSRLGGGEKLPNPIDCVGGKNGIIEAADVKAVGERTEVSGYVRRSGFAEPAAGSHVDVIVLDGRQSVLEVRSVRYSPERIPTAARAVRPHARFRVWLAQRPPEDATIRVVFHGEPANSDGCPSLNPGKSVRAFQSGE